MDIMKRLPAGLSCIMKRITFALEGAARQEQDPEEGRDTLASQLAANLPHVRGAIDAPLILRGWREGGQPNFSVPLPAC